MHGLIFAELRQYVGQHPALPRWAALLDLAGLSGQSYLPTRDYPDSVALQLIGALAAHTHLPVPALLEDFGQFMAPHLLAMYGPVIKPAWRTLEVVEHTESLIHATVRLQNPGAAPPYLTVLRERPQEVVIFYESPRRMCALGKGIVRGLAAHYGETIDLYERSCMEHGDPRCTIVVRQRGPTPS